MSELIELMFGKEHPATEKKKIQLPFYFTNYDAEIHLIRISKDKSGKLIETKVASYLGHATASRIELDVEHYVIPAPIIPITERAFNTVYEVVIDRLEADEDQVIINQ